MAGKTMTKTGALCGAAAAALAWAASPALAQDADCSFYEGKTVELVVPFDPGGGFDAYGRLVAKYMGDELGAANMIVRNEPGAGSLLATNQTWIAEPDGLRIQVMSTTDMLTSELGGSQGARYETAGFSWIGRISGEPDVVQTNPGSDIATPDDLKSAAEGRTIKIAASGSGDVVEGELLIIVLELDAQVVTGFAGSSEAYISLASGDVDLYNTSLSAGLKAEAAESAKVLWAWESQPVEGLPEVTPLTDLVADQYKPLVEAHAKLVAGGRALAAPPGLPEERLACLRDAFDRTISSEALTAEAEQLNRPLAPMSGVEIAAMIDDVTQNAPEAYLEILRETYGK